MREVVIVDAMRTPMGRRNGMFRELHPVRLASDLVKSLVARTGIDPKHIDHFVCGCVSQVGDQAFNISRNIVLDAGLPIEIPATTVDFQCGSGQQAEHIGAALVGSGQCDVVIAGGVENMSRVPMLSSSAGGAPFTERIMEEHNLIHQGVCSDEIAAKWGISREDADQIAYQSHLRAGKAQANGWFANEMAIREGLDADGKPIEANFDEGVRAQPNLEKMQTLPFVFSENGPTTAANSSQITDGAAFTVLVAQEKAAELGLTPIARIVDCTTVGSDPHLMLTGPIAATKKVLQRAAMSADQIDLFEINEAFGVVVGMWMKDLGIPHEKTNVHGGAIALGHPLGASGARLTATLVNALATHDKRYGLQTVCCGGGLGTAMIIERV
jgi:acetyl-CoA acyltransferase